MDCDGLLLTNVQCTWYLYPYYDVEYAWNQTGNNNGIKSSNTPAWRVCLLEKLYFNYQDYSYNAWYVYNKWSTRAKTNDVRGMHIIQPTGVGAYSSTCF